MHARHVCKRLRLRFPDVRLVVGLWAAQGDLTKAKERIGCGASAHVVSTLASARQQIRLLTQALLLRPENQVQPDFAHLQMEAAPA
jgi:hypothetical protein